MNQNNNLTQQYQESQILNASPTERIVLCYDAAIRFLIHARAAIQANKIEERCNKVQKAHDVVCYLQDTLDHERGGEIAAQLSKYYTYLTMRMVDINMHNSIEITDELIGLLKTMRMSWVKIDEGQKVEAESPATESSAEEKPRLAVNSNV